MKTDGDCKNIKITGIYRRIQFPFILLKIIDCVPV